MNAAPVQTRLEVADMLRLHAQAWCDTHPVSPEQAAVLWHLTSCRTARLGRHVDACDQCGVVKISYSSCWNRHFPKRQPSQLEARCRQLLPVEYFHLVFTLPETRQPPALKNRRVIYVLLFRGASATLLELATDPRRLGAQIGFTAILHTWGQNLLLQPHLATEPVGIVTPPVDNTAMVHRSLLWCCVDDPGNQRSGPPAALSVLNRQHP